MTSDQSFYRHHVFVCSNQRPPGHPRACCGGKGSGPLGEYLRARVKELGIKGARVNLTGCFDRCEAGPLLVIYPDAVWYSFKSEQDLDEIIQRHLIEGARVERLLVA